MASLEDFEQVYEDRDLVIPPDGGWGWIILSASVVCNALTEGLFYSFPLLVVEVVQSFQQPVAKMASVFSLLGGVTLMAGSLTHQLIDRLGFNAVRPAMILGTVFASAALAASSFVSSVNYLFATVGVGAGVGFGMVYSSSLTAVDHYFEKRRNLANRIAFGSAALGVSICAPLTALLLDHYGWRGAMLVQSGIYFNCAVFSLLVRPIDTINMRRRRANAKVPAVKGTPLMQRIKRDRDRKLGILIASSLAAIDESTYQSQSSAESFYSCQEVHILNQATPVEQESNLPPANKGQDSANQSDSITDSLHLARLPSSPFRSPYFILICMSNAILCLGYLIPYTFLPIKAAILGNDRESVSCLLAVIGLADFTARFAFHWIAHHFKTSMLFVINAALVLCGIVMIVAQRFSFECYAHLVVIGAIFGASLAPIKATLPLLVSHFLRLERVSIIYLLCAFSVAASGPLTGILHGFSEEPLYLTGFLFILSAILTCPLGFSNNEFH